MCRVVIPVGNMVKPGYRGRLAPTPTGRLHLGHALTFRTAWERCRQAGGTLVYRDEDLDPDRCRSEFSEAALADLRWLGLSWDEGPDLGGPYRPYRQSERLSCYRGAWSTLRATGSIYPCRCSRKDLREAAQAPHENGGEPVYPGTCRPASSGCPPPADWPDGPGQGEVCWRFRVNDGEAVRFVDGRTGPRQFVAGRDFGDFVIWRRDGVPAYELAVVVDDAAMRVSEVVRGEDLLCSTARQILLYRALGLESPTFYHAPLVAGPDGHRLAKRAGAVSIGSLREQGLSPDQILAMARDRVILTGNAERV